MNVAEIVKEIHETNKSKGFWDKDRNIGELLMLTVSELSEALEAHRGRGNKLNKEYFDLFVNSSSSIGTKSDDGETITKETLFKDGFKLYVKDSFEDEIADAIIRLFDLCGGLEIDIEWHIEQKLKYDKTRERMHGKKY